jgi:SAM-dependent methyltransferase
MEPTNLSSKTPIISQQLPDWLKDITFQSGNEPFQPLPAASHHVNSPNQWIDIKSMNLAEPLEKYLERDPYPIPSIADREGYYDQDRHFDWWLSGLQDFLGVHRALTKHGTELSQSSALLEMGCASARMLRHVAFQGNGCEVWGCDINLRHVEWIRSYLPPSIKIFQNTILPNLPLEDCYFDAVTAFSVFTHIDDFELAWLAEIRRVLKPGGIAYLSIHGENCWSNLGPEIPVYNALLRMSKDIQGWGKITPEFFKQKLPRDKTVFAWNTARNYNTNVFHSTDYIKNCWGRFFEVLEIIPSGHTYQDVVVLRKPVR